MAISPGEQWAINLTEGGYENHCRSAEDLRKTERLGLAWRRILGATGLAAPASAFEIGCGGGEKLATLALNGFAADGIDISPDVLGRAKRFFAEIGDIGGDPLRIGLTQGDFFAFETDRQYDLVYHFGVVEHYLQADDRARFWDRAVKLTKAGGWVVSVVPCGRHLMRPRMRAEELCGYQHRLAEIDYSAASHRDEFMRAGLVDVRVLPHGYFYFLSGHPSAAVRRLAFPPLFALGNACLSWLPAPASLTERFAHSLIAIGRKPA